MNIRTAERRDLSAMLDIYNYEVKNGTATFDVEPRAGAVGEAWFAAHNTGNHPLLVAEEDGKVLGYASLSPYRDFDAYLQTVELSVYVAPESRGRGIASALMEAVLRLAREDAGTHTLESLIAARHPPLPRYRQLRAARGLSKTRPKKNIERSGTFFCFPSSIHAEPRHAVKRTIYQGEPFT